MQTEKILRKIEYIENHNKNNSKVKEEIEIVLNALQNIKNFDLRDSLEEKLTHACCN